MFILHGQRNALIKKHNEYQHQCENCKDFDFTVKVYMDYYHIFFIPICPIGNKSVSINCSSCNNPLRLYSLQKEYEEKSRAPFYLYAIPLIIGILIGSAFLSHLLR
ncbi:zinc-ribbon domain-containing protein [Taibaiella lutea]|uniref:Zinc-ribbon domain-containing protein n=1 Tax=Taibaiella lutea TaxID=2608001 RepID=A0A5M6CBI3_9BACT|nr:zinc-ribbon domain-containing protein [Taibaiella lutea]